VALGSLLRKATPNIRVCSNSAKTGRLGLRVISNVSKVYRIAVPSWTADSDDADRAHSLAGSTGPGDAAANQQAATRSSTDLAQSKAFPKSPRGSHADHCWVSLLEGRMLCRAGARPLPRLEGLRALQSCTHSTATAIPLLARTLNDPQSQWWVNKDLRDTFGTQTPHWRDATSNLTYFSFINYPIHVSCSAIHKTSCHVSGKKRLHQLSRVIPVQEFAQDCS